MNLRLLLLAASVVGRAEIIDRIAVIVGSSVITESEIVREIRLTAFLEGDALDFSPASKRKAAERLVEQRLIQIENDVGLEPESPADVVNQMLEQAPARAQGAARYLEELKRTGITEQELKAHLRRQINTLRFIDLRFRPGIQITEEEIAAYFDKTLAPALRKANPGVEFSANDHRAQIEQVLIGERVNKTADAWLKDMRGRIRIEFRAAVFAPEAPRSEAGK